MTWLRYLRRDCERVEGHLHGQLVRPTRKGKRIQACPYPRDPLQGNMGTSNGLGVDLSLGLSLPLLLELGLLLLLKLILGLVRLSLGLLLRMLVSLAQKLGLDRCFSRPLSTRCLNRLCWPIIAPRIESDVR